MKVRKHILICYRIDIFLVHKTNALFNFIVFTKKPLRFPISVLLKWRTSWDIFPLNFCGVPKKLVLGTLCPKPYSKERLGLPVLYT